MSTIFRLSKSCSATTTVCRNRAGAATQKNCKRRIHVPSSASSITATQLPGTAFTPSTSSPAKFRSPYVHMPRRAHSTPSPPTPSSRNGSQGAQSETSHAVTSGTSEELADHLNKSFGTLVFPPELATRLLTHASHPVSRVVGHNARFSFTGRRIIEAYFLMFLHSCPNVNSGANYANITSNALNTYTLGEHVGREWGIGKVLRWTSMVDPQMGVKGMGHIGLHKVLGTTVEAIVGGVYHQFGATEAHRFFHTHFLPHILLKGTPRGVPDVDHSRAMQLYTSVNRGIDLPSSSPPLPQ